ncbi:PREDICTED: uncharacterized protein LOC103323200 [Prunus mume]|uniref:Uncharacterized protein LOC103323200 n=1 Tax=Prunus mume TaxID=102107 RepID=A0ABM0NE15_PRUMU|nr:PREDICTED: uncharacterized protein LOC103323200 [Prunus mume]
MDPNSFPPPARGRRGRGGNNSFANNNRDMLWANWRNHPDLEEEEEHREEVLPRLYRAEPRIDPIQPEQGPNLHPVNALNDVGALQRMIREMMEPEARKGERPTYRRPYPAYIDQIPLSPGFKVPNFTLFNGEKPHASLVEHIGRFSVQCIAIENNPLLKLRLFGNSLSGQAFTWYTSLPANSVQTWEQMESVFHDYYYWIQPEATISDLAALKQSEDEPAQDFITRDVIQEGIIAGRLKLAEKPPSVTTDHFPPPQVNMVNLNWPEQKRSRSTTEASSIRGRIVTRETIEMPKATISAGVVLCSKYKCETELEVVLDRQS